jgi:beta-lactamase family protein
MEITCTGDASFLLQGSRTVAINPQQAERGVITLFGRRQRSARLQINGPGEYEIGDVLIATVPIGPYSAQQWAHAVKLDEINVLYLDGDAEALTEEALLAIGPVDVLILAADKLPSAVKAAQDLTPRLVIPFGPHAAELCAALGVKDAAPVSRVNINGKAPRAVLLKPRRAPTRKQPAA